MFISDDVTTRSVIEKVKSGIDFKSPFLSEADLFFVFYPFYFQSLSLKSEVFNQIGERTDLVHN